MFHSKKTPGHRLLTRRLPPLTSHAVGTQKLPEGESGDQTIAELPDLRQGSSALLPEGARASACLAEDMIFYQNTRAVCERVMDVLKNDLLIPKCHVFIISSPETRQKRDEFLKIITFITTQEKLYPNSGKLFFLHLILI